MALDAPPLALHDIIHTLSPSPSPEAQAASPEPLTDGDITRMRRRLEEMGLARKDASNVSSREQELADMVLRLTESTLLDSTQLVRQAETIAGLVLQRDYLVGQVEEERARWESEKDGWARMAEALIAQRNRPGNSAAKDAELERHCSAFESDNRALREKLHDTQTRMQSLESELTKLRPILLMQPFPSNASQSTLASISHASTFLSSVPYPSLNPATQNARLKLKKKKKEARVAVYSTTQEEPDVVVISDDQKQNQRSGVDGHTGSFSQFQAHPAPNSSTQPVVFSGDHYRKPTVRPLGGPLTAPPTTMQFQVDPPVQPQAGQSSSQPPLSASAEASTSNQPPPPVTPKQPPKTKKSGSSAPLIPLTSDARTEHLLLAARKIGRERAGIVAGFIRDRQREVDAQKAERAEKERERLEKERRERAGDKERGGMSYYRKDSAGANPTTPKVVRVIGTPGAAAVSGVGGSHYPNFPNLTPGQSPRGQGQGLISGFVYEGVPARPGAAGGGSSYVQPNTPRQVAATAQQGPQSQQAQGGPNTPLASLLDAARMMDDDAGSGDGMGNGNEQEGTNKEGEASGSGVRRGASSLEEPESPVPKRRRLGTNGDTEGNDDASSRVRSALDVLADQAAAFSSADRRPGKGKVREMAGKEGAILETAATAMKGRGRGKPKAREKEKQGKGDAPPALIGRKPRVRAPAKPRKLAPALSVPGTLPVPAVVVSAKGKEKAGTAAPRMISPPGPRGSSTGVLTVGLAGGMGVSPLDRIPVVRKPGEDTHGPRKGGGGSGVLASGEGSQFGFRPVSWGRSEEESEGGSSPVVDVRELRRKRREENNVMAVDEVEGLPVGDDVIFSVRKNGNGKGKGKEAVVVGDPAVLPSGSTSLIPTSAVVRSSKAQEESVPLQAKQVKSSEQAKKPPDAEDAEMDDAQATRIEHINEASQGEPLSELQTREISAPPSEVDAMLVEEPRLLEHPNEDAGDSPKPRSINVVGVTRLAIADQEASSSHELRVMGVERMLDPTPTIQGQLRLSPSHPTTHPLAGLDNGRLQRPVLEADADVDIDLDLDADGDADADGEPDAEGEADVDAEGEIDPDVEPSASRGDAAPFQASGEPPRENGLDAASLTDSNSQGSLASRSSMLSASESIDDPSRATVKLTSQDLLSMVPDKRPRSPYVKWTKEEDELLVEAVNKYGHKWDLVQKALPSRGYHQVRQRWLRRLGLLDHKQGLSSFQTGGSVVQGMAPIGGNEAAQMDPVPKPKLGMAPLSSELAYAVLGLSSSSGIDPSR